MTSKVEVCMHQSHGQVTICGSLGNASLYAFSSSAQLHLYVMQRGHRNITTDSLLQESAPEDHSRALGRSEQLPSCAPCAVPLILTDSSAEADQTAFDVPKQSQLSTAMADSQPLSVSAPIDIGSESADCCPPAADTPAKTERALSKKAAIATLQMSLLVILLSVVRIYSYTKAAALSCRHRLQSTAAAAAPAVAESIVGSWCASMSSLTSRLCVWLATQAQRATSSLSRQAQTLGPQLLLTLLWILALTHAFKTDARGCAAACGVTSLPALTCIAGHTRAARAVRRAAAAAAAHILTAAAASAPPSPSLIKLACAHATACLAAMCKWLERPRSATSTVSLHLSSSGRQAIQACAAYSNSAVTVMTSLVYMALGCCIMALGCCIMAGVMTLPGLVLDRCAVLLVQCWPCLLVLFAYKVTAVCCIRLSVCQAHNDALLQCIVDCMWRCTLLHAWTAAAVYKCT